jgi:hypothetical protein
MTKYLLALLVLCSPALRAQGVAGTWRTEFDTQVGAQKYLFTFKQDGAATTGTAKAELDGKARDVVFKDVAVKGDTITFTESFEFQGNAVPITYTGVKSGDTLKFVRKVADFATESFEAKKE